MTSPSVSVIVPAHNQEFLIRNTLFSLNHQSYPASQYEVIVVDDCSTDGTKDLLKSLSINNLKIISHSPNKGAGATRNTGVEAAEGNLIIFCDSDFIVPFHFISNHAKEHENETFLALSGMGHWHYVLSYDFEQNYLAYLKQDMETAFDNPFLKDRKQKATDGHLLYEEDIYKGNMERFLFCPQYLKSWVKMFEEIIQVYGKELIGFQYPWLTFCTGNLSIEKNTFKELKGFDESFLRLEDWELGYRMYKQGGKFKFSEDVEAYQQLSPIIPKRNDIQHKAYLKLCEKHPDLDIYLLSLSLQKGISYTTLSNVLEQHKILLQNQKLSVHTNFFETLLLHYAFKQFRVMRKIVKRMKKNRPMTHYFQQAEDWDFTYQLLREV
ncbi:TPA: glycosyltransferase [Bacillus pseudomycoides]|nr:glycosyltransferase [Bacillus pseudomycoides]